MSARHLYRYTDPYFHPGGNVFHLFKDSSSGHLLKGFLSRAYSVLPTGIWGRFGSHYTSNSSSPTSYSRGDHYADMVSDWESASWRTGRTREVSALWANAGGSGRYWGEWETHVVAARFPMPSARETYFEHVASLACNIADFTVDEGAGTPRIAYKLLDSDTATPDVSTLSGLQSLPHASISGNGLATVPVVDPDPDDATDERLIPAAVMLYFYFSGLLPHSGDGGAFPDYPTAVFTPSASALITLEV